MAKSTRRAASTQGDGTSALGVVVRFTPKARSSGVQQLEKGGFRVASSKDFRSAAAVPNDFDGADVQYFERFGIAIVRRDGERLKPILEKAMQQKVISGASEVTAGFEETRGTWGLQAAKVLESEMSGAGIKVAVLDTGFDEGHQDFVGRSVTKKLFATRSSLDDTHGHGTHCIGTACGPLRPTSGPRYGIAYESEIYAGKVLGDDGFGTDRSVIAGMEWALDEGCHVISMSLGATTQVGDQPIDDYEQIGQVCLDAGTLVVAAAGNESSRPQHIAPVGSPANASTILAVGAVDHTFAPAPFSCGGRNSGQEVDVAAPGVDVLSSLPGNSYARWAGTSMATPHVAGVAALIAQSDPKFRGWALWARVIQITKPLSYPARDVGKGLLQAKGNGAV